MPVGMYGGDSGYSSGPSFFDFLFGGRAPRRRSRTTGRAISSARASATTAVISGAEPDPTEIKNAGDGLAGVFLWPRGYVDFAPRARSFTGRQPLANVIGIRL